jgi:SPP1 gp7 family putative phage head morphogenesis protein
VAVPLVEQIRQTRRAVRLLGLRRRKRSRGARPQVPKAVEREYFRWLQRFVRGLRAEVVRRVLPLLPAAVERARALTDAAERTDSPGPVLTELDGLQISVERGVLQPTALEGQIRAWGRTVAEYQGSELQASIRNVLGIETPLVSGERIAPLLREWITENVGLIRTMSRQTFASIEQLVVAGVNAGRRHEAIAEDIVSRFGVAERRAALIARDQVGKFYGQVQRARQRELGITRYTWRTSMDERVRPEHVEREGQVFEWSDPPEDGHPGYPINCRCTAEPDLLQVLEQAEAAEQAEERNP